MNSFDRRALFTSGAAAALLAATGVSASAGPKTGGRLKAALSDASRSDTWDSRCFDGVFMQTAAQGAVFDTLTEIAAEGTLRGELATHWIGSPDAREWVFDLREDAVFHDGAPFVAADVVASFLRHKANGYLPTVAKIEAENTLRVRLRLESGNPDLPFLLSDPRLVIYPSRNLDTAIQQGIGTGLYRVRQFVPGRQFVGVRVDTHYKDGRAGWFETVQFTSVPDAGVRAQALEGGYVDVADRIDPSGLTNAGATVRVSNGIALRAQTVIGKPDTVGTRWAMDNGRMAERWWLA